MVSKMFRRIIALSAIAVCLIHVQLLQLFRVTQYSGNVKLNKFGDKKSLPNVDLFGAMKAAAEWEVLETLVPCKNFQYK